MSPEEKIEKIKRLQQDIEVNKRRLDNAEQSVQNYLENLESLNNELADILNA